MIIWFFIQLVTHSRYSCCNKYVHQFKEEKSKNIASEKQDKYWNIFNWIFNHLQIFLMSQRKKDGFHLRQCFLLLTSLVQLHTHASTRFKSSRRIIWDKVFKNGPSKICGKQPLKKFYLVHSWILFPI